jgi:hypothetical protein
MVSLCSGASALKSRLASADSPDMDLSAIALLGLQQADGQLNAAASRIASFGSSSPDGATLDVVDLSSAMVALMSAKNQFLVNLETLKTGDQIMKATIDIHA